MAYYWPPSGGSGVQRWLFLANYLANNGIDVTVFTPKKPRVAETDQTLTHKINPKVKVVHVDGWEPMQNSKKAIGENIGEKSGLKTTVLRFVRANFFIPDARVCWSKSVEKIFFKHYSQTPFDVLITSGPPHALHLIGLKATKQLSLKWIADFRDPWVDFFQHKSLPMLSFVKQKHQRLQRNVLRNANRVVVTAPSLAIEFSRINSNTFVLTNGYEKPLPTSENTPKALVYAGSLKAQQNPKNLWLAIKELTQENNFFAANFSLEIYGKVAESIQQEVKVLGISNWITFLGYQSKEQLDERLPNSKALLLLGIDMPSTHNIIHGKLFEYMAANRPIFGIGPQPSDMKQLFKEYHLGVYTSFDDFNTIKETLLSWFTTDEIPFASKEIEKFQRDVIAESYLNLILETL